MPDTTKDVYGEIIGCDELHSSKVITDTKEKYEAGTPEFLAPLAEVTHDNASTPNKRFYDNKVRYVDIIDGDGNVKIIVSGIPCSLAAQLTGKHYNADTGEMYDAGSAKKTPWCTLSGRMELGGGEYRYFQYLKGKFSMGAETAHTKENDITVNTTELTYTPAVTIHEFQLDADTIGGAKTVKADTTDTKFTKKDTWFEKVQTPPEVTTATAASETEQPQNNDD